MRHVLRRHCAKSVRTDTSTRGARTRMCPGMDMTWEVRPTVLQRVSRTTCIPWAASIVTTHKYFLRNLSCRYLVPKKEKKLFSTDYHANSLSRYPSLLSESSSQSLFSLSILLRHSRTKQKMKELADSNIFFPKSHKSHQCQKMQDFPLDYFFPRYTSRVWGAQRIYRMVLWYHPWLSDIIPISWRIEWTALTCIKSRLRNTSLCA